MHLRISSKFRRYKTHEFLQISQELQRSLPAAGHDTGWFQIGLSIISQCCNITKKPDLKNKKHELRFRKIHLLIGRSVSKTDLLFIEPGTADSQSIYDKHYLSFIGIYFIFRLV